MSRIETKCIHEGYKAENGEPMAMPIYQSTTYKYDSTEHVGKLFDLAVPGHIYSRISNPTVGFVEEKIAALEGGVGALCTSSGQSASLISIMNILNAGDSFICASTIYGGTINLFAVTLKKFGIECIFVDANASEEDIQKHIKENTKAVFGETIANPALDILDIEKFAKIAHNNDIPLIIDNTFATPILCRPIEHGADIVIHSTTKYMDGQALQVGGVIVDSGKFNWDNGKFPEFTQPDESYHGLIYTEAFKEAAYITKARVQLIRDIGNYPSAQDAFLTNVGIETLALRMERHCRNAEKVAEFLEASDLIESVNYPFLESHKDKNLQEKYLPKGCSGVISFIVKGGKEKAAKFMDSLELAVNAVHVACTRTLVLHPATATHRQLNDQQLKAAGISPGMIRLSVGIENIDDIIEDLKKGLEAIK